MSSKLCTTCGAFFSHSRPEVRFCTKCRDAALGVVVQRVSTIQEPDRRQWRELGSGSFQRIAQQVLQ